MANIQDIERAQVRAGERVVIQSLHDRGICLGPEGCIICIENAQPKVSHSLADKLATMLWYLEEVRSLRRSADPKAFESYLDDSEVAAWLTAMNKQGRIRNTRFTGK
jgi:hypothetical protein